VAVVVPVFGQVALALRCVGALDRLTPPNVELIVLDDAGPEPVAESALAATVASGRSWRLIRHERNVGFVGTVNELFELTAPRDVVVVNSDVEVLPGWFDALASAVGERVASASTMADHGGILSLAGLPATEDADLGPRLAVVRGAVPVSARIPVAVAHCTWFRRAALEDVDRFDERFAPGYGEEVDWSLRAAARGWHHVAALGSFVRHAQGASFGRGRGLFTLQRRHELLLLTRYRTRWWGLRRFARDPATDLAAARRTLETALSAAGGGSRGLP
jgi:GT2 family glycosyltransferase